MVTTYLDGDEPWMRVGTWDYDRVIHLPIHIAADKVDEVKDLGIELDAEDFDPFYERVLAWDETGKPVTRKRSREFVDLVLKAIHKELGDEE